MHKPSTDGDVFAALARAQARGLPAAKRAEASLQRFARGMPTTFFDFGVALARFRTERHALFLGHRTFQGYLRASALVGRATAYKLLSIAAHLPRARALSLGLERAYQVSRIAARDPKAARDRGLDRLSSRALRGPGPDADAKAPVERIVRALVEAGYRSARLRRSGRRWVVELGAEDAEHVLTR